MNNLVNFRARALTVAVLIFTLIGLSGCNGSDSDSSGTATAPGSGSGLGGLGRGPAPVALGGAGNFRMLAQSAITNVPTSDVTGNVGLSPAAGSFIGIPCAEVTGTIYQADATGAGCMVQDSAGLTAAINNKGTAYTDASGRAPDYVELGAGNIGGMNLGPATYKWSTALMIPTTLTLTGGPNDVWIFQEAQGLSISAGVQIVLAGGALPENIYWAVFSAADLATTSVFKGTLISQTAIAMKTGARINGRLMAGTAITLQSNVVAP